MTAELVQLIGVLLLVAAAVVLWSPWALVAGGGLLLVTPEVGRAWRKRGGRP